MPPGSRASAGPCSVTSPRKFCGGGRKNNRQFMVRAGHGPAGRQDTTPACQEEAERNMSLQPADNSATAPARTSSNQAVSPRNLVKESFHLDERLFPQQLRLFLLPRLSERHRGQDVQGQDTGASSSTAEPPVCAPQQQLLPPSLHHFPTPALLPCSSPLPATPQDPAEPVSLPACRCTHTQTL